MICQTERGGGWGVLSPQAIMTAVPSIEIWKQALAGILHCPETGYCVSLIYYMQYPKDHGSIYPQ